MNTSLNNYGEDAHQGVTETWDIMQNDFKCCGVNNYTDWKESIADDVPKGKDEKSNKEENMKSTVVPNRNAIFSSFLYAYALSISKETNEKVDIALGVHAGDHDIYPDCRLEFYEELFNAFKIGNWNTKNINFHLPYLNYTKSDILKSALNACKELNLNFERIFKNTITSYEPDNNGISNGKTASDIERILAFHELGIQDPIEYKTPWRDVLKHALNYEEKYNS